MDEFRQVFLSWQAFLLAFGAFTVLGIVRQIGTKRNKDRKVIGGWAESRLFKMFLPVYPYLLTLILIFVPGIPLPEKLSGTLATKILYALWCGWASDKSFQIAKNVFEKGFGMKFGADK